MQEKDIDIILKLFDQVKNSSDKSDREIEKLSLVIKELFNHSTSPSHNDIKGLMDNLQVCLNDHIKETSEPIHEAKFFRDILEKIDKQLLSVGKKVNIMITAVIITVTLLVISYFFVSSSITTIINKEMSNIVKQESIILDEHKSFKESQTETEKIKVILKELNDKVDEYIIEDSVENE